MAVGRGGGVLKKKARKGAEGLIQPGNMLGKRRSFSSRYIEQRPSPSIRYASQSFNRFLQTHQSKKQPQEL